MSSVRKQTVSLRLKLLRKGMRKEGFDWLILTNPANVAYVTGFMGEDSWAVAGRRQSHLVTDSRYTEQAQNDCACCQIVERSEGMVKAVLNLIGSKGNVGVDDGMTVAFYELLRKQLKGRVKRGGRLVENLREVKDRTEAGIIEEAAGVAWKVLARSLVVKMGMTESELAGRIEFEMRRLGARPSFDTIVAFGGNASQAHYVPGSRKLRKNDTILIDFGVKWKGYCCDMTRCFAVGEAGAQYEKAYDTVLEAHRTAVSRLKAGVSVKELDEAARKAIEDEGLPPYNHGLGHGLGLEVHEGPVVSSKAKGVLKAGQVVTIEPAVYVPGRLGIRLEDDYLVTERGCKLLSGGSRRFALRRLPRLRAR